MSRNKQPEFEHQKAVFEWARNPLVVKLKPELRLLSCSLNGVKLTKLQAYRAKQSGMLKGESDIKLPVPKGGYCGLIIEMKAGKNKPTEEQNWYIEEMSKVGHKTCVCWSATEAINEIESYLKLQK